jgi:E3 ubiquitin-protein ligase SHPRH
MYHSICFYFHIKNLEIFRKNGDVRVLLLPLKSGGNGLNLIEATHVILIEPSINPSVEAQAIGKHHYTHLHHFKAISLPLFI